MGPSSAQYNQGDFSVAIGYDAGFTGQQNFSVAIGTGAGNNNQGPYSVAIGESTGVYNQGRSSVAMGPSSAQYNQGDFSIAIGSEAGFAGQSGYSVAIGSNAGSYNQQQSSVAIGDSAGFNGQQNFSVAIGPGAGNISQKVRSVAIGSQAGNSNQGDNSIAIGNQAGYLDQSTNSIVLNASSVPLNAGTTGFFVKPINSTTTTSNGLRYNPSTGEINYVTSKTFVIDHPINPEKYLIHACLEGPEAGVYYRGEGTISNNHSIEINLPDYVDKLANDFTVQVTPIYDPSITKPLLTSRVVNNKFTVYGENCDFFWTVHGKRGSIEVEPTKSDVYVKGSGPYLWI